MKYVLLFCETEDWERTWETMDQAERDRRFGEIEGWFAEHANRILHHRKLATPETATTLRLGEGDPIVSDGPFVEGKEVVSGYTEIDVTDLDEAIRVARSWPGCPLVEIRPLL